MHKKSVKLLSLMLSAVMLIIAVPMGVMATSNGKGASLEAASVTGEDKSEVESTTAEPVKPTEPTTKGEDESTTAPVVTEPTTKGEEVSSEEASSEAPKPVKMGDLDGDGRITAADARIALRISARLENPTKAQMEVGDLNKDGKITADEARAILRFAARLDAKLGDSLATKA